MHVDILRPYEGDVLILDCVANWSAIVSFCGVNDYNLCNQPLILWGWRLNPNIPNSAILSWVGIDDSSNGPVSTIGVRILHSDYVIHSFGAPFSIPLPSRNQWRKHVSGLTSPEGIHYLLYKLDPLLGVPGFSKWSMWHHWWNSSEKHVVGT